MLTGNCMHCGLEVEIKSINDTADCGGCQGQSERMSYVRGVQEEIDKIEELCEHLKSSAFMMSDVADDEEISEEHYKNVHRAYKRTRQKLQVHVINYFENNSAIDKLDLMN